MSLTTPVSSPVAIVGVGLRFPGGVRSLPDYGRLLTAGESAVSPVRPERWGPERCGDGPGRTVNHVGGFLEDVDRFDAAYFGVPPREADLLDPQHRLFLEVAWEAMSDSGRTREEWRGSRTAVVVGVLAGDYGQLHARILGIDAIGPHHITGLEFSFAAGRLAYAFDLHGPVQSVNSACSSSLLAVHQACQQLRADECDTAVAGGVSLLLTPDISVFLSSVGAMSPSGRCRPFDEGADGIVRGEGCGVVVLRRLEDALADGDRIHAVLRGSAVNNDGGSLGLTVPNGQAQADLVRAALGRAGLEPGDVDYVEAHGTGTPLGDLIELDALGSVYGAGHDKDRPLYVGSHKAVLGHMDAAAGMGGLLKAVWVTGTRTIPAQPSVRVPNPAVDWREGALAVPLAPVPTDRDRPTRAGVSAFGLSGTNVHVVVESPPEPAPGDTSVSRPYVLLVSAVDGPRLAEQLALTRERVADAGDRLGDLVASAATRRTHESHRCAVVADDRASLLAALARPDELPDGAYTGVVADQQDVPGPVFVFSGQGGQWPGMALDLYDTDPQVRAALDECAERVRAEAGWSLLDELRRAPGEGPDRFDRIQPAIFAVQVALTRWLAHRGVRPAAVVGHSLGEVAAAHAAGVLDLADATRLIVRRSEILAGFAGTGRMLAVQAASEEAVAALGALPVDVVAVNGPESVVVAGAPEAVSEAVALLDATGIRSRLLRVDAAAHSRLVADGGALLERELAGLTPAAAAVRLLSTVDPAATGPGFDAAYWARNFTSPVQLWPAVDLLLSEGDHPLVEIGPHPVLLPPLTDARRVRRRRAPVLGLLDRGLPGPVALARAVARLHVAGVPVDWAAAVGRPRHHHDLPVPGWRDGRHWLPGVPRGTQTGAGPATGTRVRVSVLDPRGRVTQEWFAGDGQPPPPRGDGRAGTAVGEPPDGPEPRTTGDPATAPVPVDTPARSIGPGPAAGAPRAAVARLASLVDLVDADVRDLLELSADDPPLGRRRGLFEQGLDSLRAVGLRRRLQERFGAELPASLVIERPSIRALADYLTETVPSADLDRGLYGASYGRTAAESGEDTGAEGPAPRQVEADGAADTGPAVTARPETGPTPDTPSPTADDGIAVTGIACRLPGADSPDAFWRLLADGVTTASGPPPGRRDDPMWWQSRAGIPEPGSYLDDIAGFDAPFFRVSPREAKVLDPQHRLFLEVAWEALEDAGSPALSLAGRPVGVYAGVGASDYQLLVSRGMGDDDGVPLSLHHGTGTSPATLAGRLSYLLGLSGPSLAVDTACSSSLTAVHLACQALRARDCEVAVAGGVSVMAAPTPLMASMAASGALAPDGRCKTFDEAADGFGVGEGSAVLVLKPLAAARRDGDRVYAVLRSSAVNQDGATGGLTVPNGRAQADLIRTALRRAAWRPADVDYVEAHGTGTPLGDPVEVRALADALGPGRTAKTPLLVGSAKANIGHLGAAAGVVGLLKVVLALRAGQLPPHPLDRPSSRIDWDRLPVAPVRRLRDWPRGAVRARAGVSAFGFSGTNVHLLVEQAPQPDDLPADEGAPYVLPVSAATPSALRAVAARTAGMLRSGRAAPADVVRTALYRRSLLEHRAVVVGPDAAGLADALDRVAVGAPHPRVRSGRADPQERLPVTFRYGSGPAPFPTGRTYDERLAGLSGQLATITGRVHDLRAQPESSLKPVYAFCHQVAATHAWAALGVSADAVAREGTGTVLAWATGRIDTATALRLLIGGVTEPPSGLLGPATRPLVDPDTETGRIVDVLPAAGPTAVRDVGTEPAADTEAVHAAGAPSPSGAHPGPALAALPGESLALVAAELFAAGLRPVSPARPGPPVDLPPYPWERTRHWYRDDVSRAPVLASAPVVSWALAAESPQGLRSWARRLARFARTEPEVSATGLGQALARRPSAAHRSVVTGSDRETLLAGLDALASDAAPSGPAVTGRPGPVLVFPGQGWQWPGMGRGLLESSPVFERTVTECSAVVEELAGWSVLEVLREARALDRVDVVQPAMFAVMVGLARVWQELGVEPAAVVGHSQGEIAAACVAGVLDLREATRVVVARSAAVRAMAGDGAMVSIAAGADESAGWLPADWGVAAVNGPGSTVVCGPAAGVSDLVGRCEAEGARPRVIPVDYASHSADVERIRDRVAHGLGTVDCRTGRIPLYSTVLGAPVDGSAMDSAYWYDNLRRPVRFQEAVEALARAGHTAFVECGAHPVLGPAIEQTLDALELPTGERPAVLATLRRDDDSPVRLHSAAALAWTHGLDVRWSALLPAAPPAALPGPQEAGPAAESGADQRFWHGVTLGKPETLASELGLDEEQSAALAVVLPGLARWRRSSRERAAVDTWRYRELWEPAPHFGPASFAGQAWLVAVPAGWDTDPFVTACLAALPGARPFSVGADASRAELAEELRDAAGRPFTGVLSLLALDEAPHPKYPGVPAGLLATTALFQALDDSGLEATCWSVTRAAVAAVSGERVEHPLQAHVAGLSRAAGVENPARLAGLVDLPAVPDESCARSLRAVLAAGPAEDQVAVRPDGVRVRRLVRAPLGDAVPGRRWAPHGTTLVTGGTGALGGHVSRWLARLGAPHLLLLSRGGPDAPGAGALREELLGLGARRVTVASCDVSDADALGAVIEALPPEEPLTAVFHTAGVVHDAPVARMTGAQVQDVLAPKTAAVRTLHEATLGHDLSAFVLFSSFSGMLPNAGQGAYAAANAGLDAFARWRRASGRPTLSVSWGAWAGAGMASDAEFSAMLGRGGMDLMTAHLAVTALRQALDHDDTTVMIAHVDWARFAESFASGRRHPLVEGLFPAAAGTAPAPDLLGRLTGLRPQQQHEELLTVVCRETAVVLGHRGAQDVRPDHVFRDIGFDSVTAIELRNRLTTATGLRVPATAVFDHPTPVALAGHLLEQFAPDGPEPEAGGPDRFDSMDVHDLIRTARRATS